MRAWAPKPRRRRLQEITSRPFKVRKGEVMTTDRDQSIERLLRRALPPDPQAPERDCPDAEMLAALTDDTLPAAARREVETHLAGCHRCQMLTAAIVRAEAPAGTQVAEVPAWRRRAFNWLVPAAAAATAVALWVLVPGQGTPPPTEPTAERSIAPAPPSAPLPSQEVRSEPLQIPIDGRADEQARERDANVGFERAAPAAPPAAALPESSLKAEAPAAEALAAARFAGDAASARLAPGFQVVSPNPQILWRVGPGPVVQYSADGGATWASQQTGASAELTAGSSPTPETCWLVGRGGLVLRTTDGGRQWQRIGFPETVDLTAVSATTALDATVVLADGRRVATRNGGQTWTEAGR
jgi:hypothetical protein